MYISAAKLEQKGLPQTVLSKLEVHDCLKCCSTKIHLLPCGSLKRSQIQLLCDQLILNLINWTKYFSKICLYLGLTWSCTWSCTTISSFANWKSLHGWNGVKCWLESYRLSVRCYTADTLCNISFYFSASRHNLHKDETTLNSEAVQHRCPSSYFAFGGLHWQGQQVLEILQKKNVNTDASTVKYFSLYRRA